MTTTIKDFCVQNNIKWFPIRFDKEKLENGVKELMPISHQCYAHIAENKDGKKYRHYKPSQSDFNNCSDEVIAERQNLFAHTCDHIAIDTRSVFHIDIDVPRYSPTFDEIAKTTPYFTSTTKSYGKHILLVNPDFRPPSLRMQLNSVVDGTHKEGVELLSGQWSYAPRDGIMINAGKPIMHLADIENWITNDSKPKPKPIKKAKQVIQASVLEDEDASSTVTTEGMTASTVSTTRLENRKVDNLEKFKLMKDCFCKERLNNYDAYIQFTWGVKQTFGDTGMEMWDEICKRSTR